VRLHEENAMSNSRTADKFVVRLPDGLRGRLADAAAARHESMNTLTIQALESYLDHHAELQIILGALREQLERQGKLPSPA
jgi:predicted transcriptional regulator